MTSHENASIYMYCKEPIKLDQDKLKTTKISTHSENLNDGIERLGIGLSKITNFSEGMVTILLRKSSDKVIVSARKTLIQLTNESKRNTWGNPSLTSLIPRPCRPPR